MTDITTGRESDAFTLRMPDGMRDQLKTHAAGNGRTLNAEIVARLQATLEAMPSTPPTLPPVRFTVSEILAGVRDQTARRGGSPSVGNIEEANAAVISAARAYVALRPLLSQLAQEGHLNADKVLHLELAMAHLSNIAH